jgi:hypothetical protein
MKRRPPHVPVVWLERPVRLLPGGKGPLVLGAMQDASPEAHAAVESLTTEE